MGTNINSNSLQIVGESPAIRTIFEIVNKSADSDSTVMIFGESGTGKELVARALHHNSSRDQGAFIAVNCAAIPHDLLESELFGYEKGAFTGAAHTRVGRLELAHGGTIFLDEIGDMPPALQVKLLRVLSEREIDRIGGTRSIPIDVRVIAATNVDIEIAIQEGRFR
ncbi:MAG: RNA polymerase subunit sigma-54, partial [Nitrospinae bacterium CG11_big_fil_rev_8_21_14_0_20_56_8]